MENTNKNQESGFQINQLILVESHLKRINNVHFPPESDTKMNINVNVSVNNKTVLVAETVSVKQLYNETEEVTIEVQIVGVFENIGKSQITDLDEFGKINGAAIIFPYIREHITTLSLKSGIGPIILPPVNFANNASK